jgi:hypothetical protein
MRAPRRRGSQTALMRPGPPRADDRLYLGCGRLIPLVAGSRTSMRVISRLEDAGQLDRTVAVGQRAARWIRPGRVRDTLHGVWLGHPLHPLLVQVPAGSWLSVGALDLLAPRLDTQARRLVAGGASDLGARGCRWGDPMASQSGKSLAKSRSCRPRRHQVHGLPGPPQRPPSHDHGRRRPGRGSTDFCA